MKKLIINFPHSWGDSGALYLQSALAEVISCLGSLFVELPIVSGVDMRVLTQWKLANLVRTGM